MTVDPTTLSGWRWLPGMLGLSVPPGPRYGSRVVAVESDGGLWLAHKNGDVRLRSAEWVARNLAGPALGDDATGGCLIVLLGPEAWRVRYSPSKHKQAAGMAWLADRSGLPVTPFVGCFCFQGEAAAEVAKPLGRWGGA